LFSDDDEKNDNGNGNNNNNAVDNADGDGEKEVKTLFDRNHPRWVGYPGIFLDQQLAACADIGFVGTSESSFSDFITELREDNLEETC
jgi:hypothetical protein